MSIHEIVGIDCSTSPRRVGLSRGSLEPDGRVRVHEVLACSKEESPVRVLAAWLERKPNSLLALDAPLGWPAPLGLALTQHSAGQPIATARHDLFDRNTDRSIYERYRVKPLSVGANLIAHTAHSALELLGSLRSTSNRPLPLAWSPCIESGPAAIEVYPAATLAARNLPHRGADRDSAACELLARELELPEGTELGAIDEHALDSLICLLAGVDFLRGEACPPEEHLSLAEREGWIWVRRRDYPSTT